MAKGPNCFTRLRSNTEGSVFVEYVVIATVSIAIALALAAIGPGVVRNYATQQQQLYRSNP